MGLYIVQSLQNPKWYKIGFHKKTDPYYRYIINGFFSTKCPEEIKDKVSFEDLKLIYWFKNLSLRDGHKIHRQLKKLYKNFSEWYFITENNLSNIFQTIVNQYHGVSEKLTEEDLNKTINWKNDITTIFNSANNYLQNYKRLRPYGL